MLQLCTFQSPGRLSTLIESRESGTLQLWPSVVVLRHKLDQTETKLDQTTFLVARVCPAGRPIADVPFVCSIRARTTHYGNSLSDASLYPIASSNT